MDPAKVREALKIERKTDIDESARLLKTLSPRALAKKELAMLNLCVLSTETSMGGRIVVQLGPDRAIGEWSPCVRPGSIVRVSKMPKGSKMAGDRDADGVDAVVTRVNNDSLSVVAQSQNDSLLDFDGRLWLVLLVDEATYKRMDWAISRVLGDETSSASAPPLGRLAHLTLGQASTPRVQMASDVFLMDKSLNEPQKAAVCYALDSEICLIHGPPGTGKTSTVVEIVRQLVKKGERVLICGPSNVSVDNLVERLSPHVEISKMVRLGHPARLLDSVLKHSLDLRARNGSEGQILDDLRREINATVKSALSKKSRAEKSKLWASLRDLRKEYRDRERKIVRDLLLGAQIVVATLFTSGSTYVTDAVNSLGGRRFFDTIVIDEVSQALLPQCWIPLVVDPYAGRLVVAGDNLQLPPTIVSTNASVKKMLETTLFDTLIKYHGEDLRHTLTIQYRMAKEIMAFPSKIFYKDQLAADPSVADQRLYELGHVERAPPTETVLLWIDTMGGLYQETKDEESLSTRNEGEADLVVDLIEKLRSHGVKASDIGVITPYNAQTALLVKALPEIEVSTVDGFQGREKEVIILTMVRSNDDHEVGFLDDRRRINVAITRARRQLCIVGDTETVGDKGFLKTWVEWCMDNADLEYAP